MSLYTNLNMTHLKIETVNRAEEENAEGNLTLVVQVVSEMVQKLESREEEMTEAEYEQFLADVWVGVVLTLMVLSCVCCMCSCLLYHKFQQWKRHVLEQRAAAHDPDGRGDTESLPSYTLVSGLPSYAEALEQLKQVRALGQNRDSGVDCDKYGGVESTVVSLPDEPTSPSSQQSNQMSRLSVAELLQLYKLQQQQQLPQQLPQQQQQQQMPATMPHTGTTKI